MRNHKFTFTTNLASRFRCEIRWSYIISFVQTRSIFIVSFPMVVIELFIRYVGICSSYVSAQKIIWVSNLKTSRFLLSVSDIIMAYYHSDESWTFYCVPTLESNNAEVILLLGYTDPGIHHSMDQMIGKTFYLTCIPLKVMTYIYIFWKLVTVKN